MAQPGEQGFGTIRRQYDPAEEEAAVAVPPDQEQWREQPQAAARFHDRDGEREEEIGEELRPIEREGHRDGGSGETGDPCAMKAAGATPGPAGGQSAERGQQQGAQQHDRGKPAQPVRAVEKQLRQPLVGKVEMPHDVFAGVSEGSGGGGVSKWIGNGQRVRAGDVLAGFEVPPEIGIANFGRQQAHTEYGGEHGQERGEIARRLGGGRNGRRVSALPAANRGHELI